MLRLQLSTIIFQLLNFLILLGVLTWFFYRPVMRIIHDREARIAAQLRAADEREQQADALRTQLDQQAQQASVDAETLLATMRKQAAEERERIVTAAHQEAARLVSEAQQTIAEQERLAFGRVEAQVRESALAIAGSLIRQAAGLAVHQQLLDTLLQQGIKARDHDAESLATILARNHAGIVVELAYAPSPELEDAIRAMLSRSLGITAEALNVQFRLEPSLFAGARVLAGEFAIDFSLHHALAEIKTTNADGDERK